MRRVAPELLLTAKTQRWTPEELLRALVEIEITARDASSTRLRRKQTSFPTVNTFEGFELSARWACSGCPVRVCCGDYGRTASCSGLWDGSLARVLRGRAGPLGGSHDDVARR
jgi:hypothetical protein